jgi:hypothetical protein
VSAAYLFKQALGTSASTSLGELANLYRRFFFAAAAPFLPRVVRIFFGRCAIVLFFLAAADAFLMLRRAAVRCLEEGIVVMGFCFAFGLLFWRLAIDRFWCVCARSGAPGVTMRDEMRPSAARL